MERTTVENLKELIRAGRAKTPATKVIMGGTLVNVMSEEIYPADIAVYKDTIVAVGDVKEYIGEETEVIDAKGRYLVPGMIDGHIHSECSKLSITSYAKAVVPRGTTSMISGLDEYISVSGLEGLQEVQKEVQASPLKVFWGAPYKTPYTIPQSTVAFNFTKEVHEEVQKWPQCYGVWETVREFIQEEDENTLGAIAEAFKNRLPVFGCAPMARGNDLNGYLCAGVRLDHESYDHEEVVEKMRKGMHMLIRESSVTHFLAENIKAVTEVNPAFARRVSFCTDDVTASDVLEKGHLDNVVRLAIQAGVKPMTAIQMATINSAEAYRIDHMVGSICPGRIADILFVEDLENFEVKEVMTNGKMVAKDHKLTYDLQAPERSSVLKGELKCKKTTKEDFEYMVNRCYTMYMQQCNNVLFNLLDSHDTERLMNRLKNLNVFYQQLAVLFTMPGSPCIYYGTEIAMEGGHDPDCRRCMPWDEMDSEENRKCLEEMKKLISLRKSEKTFKSLYFHFPDTYREKRCVEYIKLDDAGNKIQVVLNCTKDSVDALDGGEILFARGYENGKLAPDGTLIRRI
mgnify:CR=1 FL=1